METRQLHASPAATARGHRGRFQARSTSAAPPGAGPARSPRLMPPVTAPAA